MKVIAASFILATASAIAQQAAPELTLNPGSAVSLAALSAATWVQGEAPAVFEPGKVYLFECWATWCGPCLAAIPHVNGLHKKYHDKGLRIFGMNVWEDGLDKVEKFVKSKGDGMSYPVAYTGKGSAFENEWLKPAGVRGIPHAFVVKDGKLLLTSHPSQLTDAVIEALLSGAGGAEKVIAEMSAAKQEREKSGALTTAIRKAIAARDATELAARIAEFEKANPTASVLADYKFDLVLISKDWPAAIKMIEEMPKGGIHTFTLMRLPGKVMGPDGEYPVEVFQAISKKYTTILKDPRMAANPIAYITLGSLQWKAGEKEDALATAKKAEEIARDRKDGRPVPMAPFERFTASLEKDTLPFMSEFGGWLNEEIKKAQAAAKDFPAAPAEESSGGR